MVQCEFHQSIWPKVNMYNRRRINHDKQRIIEKDENADDNDNNNSYSCHFCKLESIKQDLVKITQVGLMVYGNHRNL